MIINSIYTVLIIFILIGVGVFISHKKWVDRTTAQAFPKIIINFSLPSQLLVSFSQNFTSDELLNSGWLIAVPFIATIIGLCLARLIIVIFNISKTRRGVFTVLFTYSNSVFIGFPVAQALFGDAGMPYATFFFLANTTLFWTFGYYAIKRDAEYITGEVQKINGLEILKKVFSVSLIMIIVAVLLVFLNIKLPEVIIKPAEFLGNLTTPLSMMFIGCVLYDIGFKSLKMERDIVLVILGRFLFSGLIMFGICWAVGIGGLAKNVYLTQTTLPVMTTTIIVSELHSAESDFAAKGMAWTTILSLVTIPLVMLIFNGG